MLAQVDQREMLAELAMKMRHTIHSEKVKPNELFNKKKEEQRVKQAFSSGRNEEPAKKSMAERIKAVNEHFRKKGAKNE